MFNFSANNLSLLSRTECRSCVVFVMKDHHTKRVYRLYDFTKSQQIASDQVYCVFGKVNSADKIYLVMESVRPDTKIECFPVRAGGMLQDSFYESLLFDAYVTEAGMRAEEEGFDAVVIDTVSDAGMAALRSHLSIPVIAPGLAAYTLAMSLGRHFSVLTQWKGWRHLNLIPIETNYKLQKHCASVRAIEVPPEMEAQFPGLNSWGARGLIEKDPEWAFGAMADEARKAIDEDGADTLIVASLAMGPAAEYIRPRVEVPVIDPGPLAFALAESLVDLGLSHSRLAYLYSGSD